MGLYTSDSQVNRNELAPTKRVRMNYQTVIDDDFVVTDPPVSLIEMTSTA